MDIAFSINRVPIRLTEERWNQIVNSHDELAEYYEDCLLTVESPELVLAGTRGSLKAIKGYGRKRYLTVVYKELSPKDGFVITAYFVRKIDRRSVVWQR